MKPDQKQRSCWLGNSVSGPWAWEIDTRYSPTMFTFLFFLPIVAILLYQKQTDESRMLFMISEVAEDETWTPFRSVEIVPFL